MVPPGSTKNFSANRAPPAPQNAYFYQPSLLLKYGPSFITWIKSYDQFTEIRYFKTYVNFLHFWNTFYGLFKTVNTRSRYNYTSRYYCISIINWNMPGIHCRVPMWSAKRATALGEASPQGWRLVFKNWNLDDPIWPIFPKIAKNAPLAFCEL